MKKWILMLSLLAVIGVPSAVASIAYGSLNNFDTVNDTGVPCHGFEIEIDGIHSKDITYTYDWNHYGVPKITEDNSDPLCPKVFVRYESGKNPDGSWTAYTAVPSGPIAPTDGHQFTNPSVNFGGEHFGVGFYGAPLGVKYNWLIDDGAGNLIYGGAVNIATPAFVYYPPVPAQNIPAQVQAFIEPPPPPEVPVLEFGEACWVKATVTTSHNNNKVELRDLVSDDPEDPDDRNWKNGEPDEVEVEWALLQTEFSKPDGGAFGVLEGAPEDLPNGDEVITRRYDFFKYVGPLDEETGEAKADKVGPDGIHGEGVKIINGVEVDLSTVVVVGDYIGAQMAGFDAAGQIGLIDHLQVGEIDIPYVERTMVIGGTPPLVTTLTGSLPAGMDFDVVTGVLSGTPTEIGAFTFTLHSTDSVGGDVTRTYTLTIIDGDVVPPPHITVTATASPAEGGVLSGSGDYLVGADVTVDALANPGFAFVNWTEAGSIVSETSSYLFTADVNRDLVAHFVPMYSVTTNASPVTGGATAGDGIYLSGDPVNVSAIANPGYYFVNWTENGTEVSTSADFSFAANANRSLVANFARVTYTISTSAAPSSGGSTSGGTVNSGDSITVVATPNPGYAFVKWTESGTEVSTSASYTFTVTGDRALVANFAPAPTTRIIKRLQLSNRIPGGTQSVGSVTLSAPAAGGALVFLASSNSAVLSVPESIYVAAGQKSASFVATAASITQSTSVVVSATVGNSTSSLTVKVTAAK